MAWVVLKALTHFLRPEGFFPEESGKLGESRSPLFGKLKVDKEYLFCQKV